MALLIGGCSTPMPPRPDTPVILTVGLHVLPAVMISAPKSAKIWGPDAGAIFDRIGDDFSNFISSRLRAPTGRVEELSETVGDERRRYWQSPSAPPTAPLFTLSWHYPDDLSSTMFGYMLQNAEEYLYERNFANSCGADGSLKAVLLSV